MTNVQDMEYILFPIQFLIQQLAYFKTIKTFVFGPATAQQKYNAENNTVMHCQRIKGGPSFLSRIAATIKQCIEIIFPAAHAPFLPPEPSTSSSSSHVQGPIPDLPEISVSKERPLPKIPEEVCRLIISSTMDTSPKKFALWRDNKHYGGGEHLHYAQTILPMKLVKALNASGAYPEDIRPTEKTECCCDVQFWQKRQQVRVSLDEQWSNQTFFFDWQDALLSGSSAALFDGMNGELKALMGAKKEQGYALHLLAAVKCRIPKPGNFIVDRRHDSSVFYRANAGELYTTTLHPDSDNYIISGKSSSGDGFVGRGMLGTSPCIFTIPEMFQKILYLGSTLYLGPTYLGLLSDGRLATIHYDFQDAIHVEIKRVLRNDSTNNEDTFIDMAVDNTRITSRGFRPYLGFLNTSGEVFESNVLEFGRPTLLLRSDIKIENIGLKGQKKYRPPRIWYDDCQIGLVDYKKKHSLQIVPAQCDVLCLCKKLKGESL
jgi:hypothetical protein